jgi:hypothetical protein
MTKPMAWTSVGVGMALVALGALGLALRPGPWSGAFLTLGMVNFLVSAINLNRTYDANGQKRPGLLLAAAITPLGLILNWHLLAAHPLTITISFILICGSAAGLVWNYYAQRS